MKSCGGGIAEKFSGSFEGRSNSGKRDCKAECILNWGRRRERVGKKMYTGQGQVLRDKFGGGKIIIHNIKHPLVLPFGRQGH